MAYCVQCACASLRRRPARCTSGARGRHCTTGSSRAATAGSSCCASRTPTASARRPRTSSRSSTRCEWLGHRLGRGADLPVRSAPIATPRSSSSCSTTGHAYRSTAGPDEVKACKEEHGNRGFRGEDEGEGAVRLRVPDEGATVVNDVIRGESGVRERAPGRPRDRPRRRHADLPPRRRGRRPRRGHHPRRARRRPLLQHARSRCCILQAMGEEAPLYAHLPLLHGPDGKKLSKRHGAASVQDLRDRGYLPEAVRQLPRAARLGLRRVRRRSSPPTSCSERVLARARLEVAGGVRRAEAAPHERPLPARARRSTT